MWRSTDRFRNRHAADGGRFLTDHLEGDHYFHIHREGHNLDRCRTQLTLVKDMQEKLPQMNAIIQKYK